MKLLLDIGSTISWHTTFGQDEPFENIAPVCDNTKTFAPTYNKFIPPLKLRRMSTILKMSLTTAIYCVGKFKGDIGAIIIGTGLGCMNDTATFLLQIKNATGDSLSPTSFIHSTHNTVSGQISLFFKNHGYNITHSQNNLSFEMSLLDSMNVLRSNHSIKAVLVGAADEKIDFLDDVQGDISSNHYPITELSSSFVVRPGNKAPSGSVVIDRVCFDYTDSEILSILDKKAIDLDSFDVVLHSNIESIENNSRINYLDFSGINLSASAFACHYAFDLLHRGKGKKALIINNLCPESTGFTFLSVIE
jgi:3-oxoacyl-[acyl-carrier-protein] synthase II